MQSSFLAMLGSFAIGLVAGFALLAAHVHLLPREACCDRKPAAACCPCPGVCPCKPQRP